ncbi:MAG: tetratricopeptide repeat protein [Muribaculaceae bacterium]
MGGILCSNKCDAQSLYLNYIDSADVCIKAHNWLKAERYLLLALKQEPANSNNSLIISNLATVQRYQRKYVEALKNYDVALSMTPKAVTLLKNRASLYLEMDSLSRAYMDFEKVTLLDREDIESRYYHGLIALRKGQLDVAQADIDDLERINKYSPYTIEAQGTLYKTQGKYDEAIERYSSLIKMQAEPSYQTLINRAECYLEVKNLNNAEADIKKAVMMQPTEPYIYVLRARLNKLRFNERDKERDLQLAEKYGISREMAIFFMK